MIKGREKSKIGENGDFFVWYVGAVEVIKLKRKIRLTIRKNFLKTGVTALKNLPGNFTTLQKP